MIHNSATRAVFESYAELLAAGVVATVMIASARPCRCAESSRRIFSCDDHNRWEGDEKDEQMLSALLPQFARFKAELVNVGC